MRRKLQSLLRLSRHEKWILAQAWILLLTIDLGLRLLPFSMIQQRTARHRESQHRPSAEEDTAIIHQVQRLVDIAARHHLYPMSCLRRALALQWLLGRQGIVTELRIGVRKEDDTLLAHAWVEYAGQPVGEPDSAISNFASLGTQAIHK